MQTFSERILLCKHSFKCKWGVSRILQMGAESGRDISKTWRLKESQLPLPFLPDWFKGLRGIVSSSAQSPARFRIPFKRVWEASGVVWSPHSLQLTLQCSLETEGEQMHRMVWKPLLHSMGCSLPPIPSSHQQLSKCRDGNIFLTPNYFFTFTSMTQFKSFLRGLRGCTKNQKIRNQKKQKSIKLKTESQ